MKRLLALFLLLTVSGPAYAATPAYQDPLANQKSTSSLLANEQQLSCLITAVEKREDAIRAALEAFNAYVGKTLEVRKSLIGASYKIADGNNRRMALRAVWKKFGFTWRDSQRNLKSGVKLAWDTYRKDRSDCKITGYDDEQGGLGMDSQF